MRLRWQWSCLHEWLPWMKRSHARLQPGLGVCKACDATSVAAHEWGPLIPHERCLGCGLSVYRLVGLPLRRINIVEYLRILAQQRMRARPPHTC